MLISHAPVPIFVPFIVYKALRELPTNLLVSFHVFECVAIVMVDIFALTSLLVIRFYFGGRANALAQGFNLGYVIVGSHITMEFIAFAL